MYAIIDIETTGGNPIRDKITEIAIVIHDGKKIIKEYQSLVNPEKRIPYFIAKMTGITDEMVSTAPRFFEIAKEIVKITENTIVVAHNASFDYNFIKAEFKSLGYNFQRQSLCTVKLSRKLIPGMKSYSLGKLCKELGIPIENRHRAGGDALATAKLFELLVKKQPDQMFMETMGELPGKIPNNSKITKELIEQLPQKTGIYYFIDSNEKIIYIGKSKNIRKRVISHLNNGKSERALKMISQIEDISFELTGSELLALLRESEEIKHHQPIFNRAQRRSLYNFGLFSYQDENNYLCLKIDKTLNGNQPHTSFHSMEAGKQFLFRITEKFHLCQNLTGLYATTSACFQYVVKQCKGACIGEETPESYNQRVEQALEYASFLSTNLIVLDTGRSPSETSYIMIERGKYLGYGFIEKNTVLNNPDDFKFFLKPASDNRDARQIISGFLRNKRTGKRIEY